MEAPLQSEQSGKASLKTLELNLNKETETLIRGYRVREFWAKEVAHVKILSCLHTGQGERTGRCSVGLERSRSK